jgi:hypothetical protein
MDITTHKEVTHEICMTQDQLGVLVVALESYKREIVDRLPQGEASDPDLANMTHQFRNALDAGWR